MAFTANISSPKRDATPVIVIETLRIHADRRKRLIFVVKKFRQRTFVPELRFPILRNLTMTKINAKIKPNQLAANVPHAIPVNPKPNPNTNVRLKIIFITFTPTATIIGTTVLPIPMNQPLIAMIASCAGVPHITILKYVEAISLTSPEGPNSSRSKESKGR